MYFEFIQYNPEFLSFYSGTFDTTDIFACLLGAFAAWAVTKLNQ
jgi:glycopeptide antibiotics resistance protein